MKTIGYYFNQTYSRLRTLIKFISNHVLRRKIKFGSEKATRITHQHFVHEILCVVNKKATEADRFNYKSATLGLNYIKTEFFNASKE